MSVQNRDEILSVPAGRTRRRVEALPQIGLILAALLVLLALPYFVGGYIQGVLTFAFYVAVFAMAWDLLFGYSGEINFGPTFLIGLGAYSAALLSYYLMWPVWACIAVGTVAAIIGGLLLTGPALRFRGPYFGLITLVSAILLEKFVVLFGDFTGGEIGLPVSDFLTISSEGNYYYALGLMLIAAVSLLLIVRSPLGLIMQAGGQDSVATEALGFSVTRYKFIAFIVSAFFSGIAGAMLVFYLGSAAPATVLAVPVTLQIIIAVILGGRRSIIGPMIGAIFLVCAEEVLRPLGTISQAAVALIALVVLMYAPDGFIGLFRRGKMT